MGMRLIPHLVFVVVYTQRQLSPVGRVHGYRIDHLHLHRKCVCVCVCSSQEEDDSLWCGIVYGHMLSHMFGHICLTTPSYVHTVYVIYIHSVMHLLVW